MKHKVTLFIAAAAAVCLSGGVMVGCLRESECLQDGNGENKNVSHRNI